jgi:hypothetical protein
LFPDGHDKSPQVGDAFYTIHIEFIFGMPDARMQAARPFNVSDRAVGLTISPLAYQMP